MKKPIKKLISMPDKFVYLTVLDRARPLQEGFNESNKLAIWSKKGKTLLSAETYESLVKSTEFDLVECPFDDYTTHVDSKKRLKKLIDRTSHFVNKLFGEENNSKVLYLF
jgi:hypothetical protein